MNYYMGSDGSIISSDELHHYGVIGMKWGIRKAGKNNTTYKYRSHATNVYAKKSKKADAKGDTKKAEKYKNFEKRSADLDRQMQSYAETVGKGKAAAQLVLTNSRTYAAAKMATGNTKYASRIAGLAASTMGGLGDMPVRALYVRGYDRSYSKIRDTVASYRP